MTPFYGPSQFSYDAEHDQYLCTQGQPQYCSIKKNGGERRQRGSAYGILVPRTISRKDLPHETYHTGKWLRRQGLSPDGSGNAASRVIPLSVLEELLETYQMWEEREHKTNRVVILYWLIALHLSPKL
jgi:hypothetical protein